MKTILTCALWTQAVGLITIALILVHFPFVALQGPGHILSHNSELLYKNYFVLYTLCWNLSVVYSAVCYVSVWQNSHWKASTSAVVKARKNAFAKCNICINMLGAICNASVLGRVLLSATKYSSLRHFWISAPPALRKGLKWDAWTTDTYWSLVGCCFFNF